MKWLALLLLACSCGGGGGSPGRDAALDAAGAPEAGPHAALPDAALPDASPCAPLPALSAVDPAGTPELVVAGDPGSPLGIFDPSPIYPAGAAGGAMSYSSVSATNDIRTRIAVSSDAGATWQYLADANASSPQTVDSSDAAACPGGTCSGRFISEVSSLAFDPFDPDAGRRWKLYTHSYLVLGADVLRYDYGFIAEAVAASPAGPWSTQRKLVGWTSTSPVSSTGATLLSTSLPELADCLALTEPGVLVLPGGALDLSLGCVSLDGGAPRIRVVLLRSADHGASFQFLRTLLSSEDARCLGSPEGRINAADLFFAGGHEYVSVTPDSASGYHGCLVLPIDDPVSGAVRRSAAGGPVAVRRLDAPGRFTGACSYAEGATALGYVVPIAFLGEARPFRMFRTGLAAP